MTDEDLIDLEPESDPQMVLFENAVILSKDQWDDNVNDRRRSRRRDLAQSILLALALLAILFLVDRQLQTEKDRKDIAKTNQIVLKSIERQTSPEAQAARTEATNRIVLQVDCNGRRAMEEALNKIASERPELFGAITLTDNCPKGDNQ